MVIKSSDSFDPAQAALIVTYGNTNKKHRALNRPALVLGKARGCDIGLVAPDVSHVHCLIVRTADGFHLRDCASRTGTRLNGQTISEVFLRDGDILQVGPFSFQVYLPPHLRRFPADSAATSDRVRRLERSRRNLARLALAHRRRLRELQVGEEDLAAAERALTDCQAGLDHRAATLREQIRDYENRFRRLEQAERDLACDREILNQELAALQARAQHIAKPAWVGCPSRDHQGAGS